MIRSFSLVPVAFVLTLVLTQVPAHGMDFCEFARIAPLSGEFMPDGKGGIAFRGHVEGSKGLKPLDWIINVLRRPLGITVMERAYQTARQDPRDIPTTDKILDAMGVTVHLGPRQPGAESREVTSGTNDGSTGEVSSGVVGTSPQLDKFPEKGPVLIVMNHPHMGVEALAMMRALRGKRDDVKILLMDGAFASVPGIGEHAFPLKTGPNGERQFMASLKAGKKWLEDGHVIIVFPSGKLSYREKGEPFSKDPEWQRGANWLVEQVTRTNEGREEKQPDLQIVPVFAEGEPSKIFQMTRRHLPGPISSLMMLPEFAKRVGTEMHLSIGDPVRGKDLPKDNPTLYLRALTYAHAGDYVPGDKPRPPASQTRKMAEIAPQGNTETMIGEVEALRGQGRMLVEKGGLETFLARPEEIPELMKEIGRLREVTFRAAGEGSGKERDLDRFDEHYRHIFVWDPKEKRLVGAYRLGLGDEIMTRMGPDGFYNHETFEMSKFLEKEGNHSVELGRTFVQPDYQRNRWALFLLWRGIGEFMVQNPQYKAFFGPVSMSADYKQTSQQLLMDYTMRHSAHPQATELVSPRHPATARTTLTPEEAAAITNHTNISNLGRLIGSIEPDGRPMPMLFRQYDQFNPQYLAWDRDAEFNTVDGLIYVDMTKAPAKSLKMYLGDDGARTFLERNGVDPNTVMGPVKSQNAEGTQE